MARARTDTNPTYVEVNEALRYLLGGQQFIFTSERDGYQPLCRYYLGGHQRGRGAKCLNTKPISALAAANKDFQPLYYPNRNARLHLYRQMPNFIKATLWRRGAGRYLMPSFYLYTLSKSVAASTLFFENTAGRILVDPAGYLRTHWAAGPRVLANSQVFLQQLLRAMLQHELSKVLINQVDMLPLTLEEQAWVNQEWLPRAAEAGYRFGAIVVATNLYTRLATAGVTANPNGLPVRYRSFDHEDQAIEWLEQQ